MKKRKDEQIGEILSLKSDFLFKLLMGDERNKDILANFLSAVLALPVNDFADIQFLDTILKKQHKDDKYSILDVNLKTKDGTLYNIEIQHSPKKAFKNRAVYYTGKRLSNQLGEGDTYEKLSRTISISIVDFPLFPYEKYHSTFWLKEEEEGLTLTDLVRIDFLELPKAKALRNKRDDIKQLWMNLINSETEEELKMLAEKNKMFEKAMAEVIRLSADEQVRAEYEARLKAERDRLAEIAYGIDQGIAQGKAEGEAKKSLEIAKNMKQAGMDAELIAKMTSLSAEEIAKL